MRRFQGLALLILLSFSNAVASPCGTSGMTALRANDGNGFLFYLFRKGPDIYFSLDGKEISFPEGTNGPRRFVIDGILYESLLLKPEEFMKSAKGIPELDILKAHQRYEFDYISKSPSPLKQLEEVGPRKKAAAAGEPGFTFYLWLIKAPQDSTGPRQYFLTSVSNNEVVVLSAMMQDQSAEDRVMKAFETYASSFQHVLKKDQCPETPSK